MTDDSARQDPTGKPTARQRLLKGLDDDNLYTRDIMRTLSRGRGLIFGTVAVSLLLAVIWLKSQTPLYAASITVAPAPAQNQSSSARSGLSSVLSGLNMGGMEMEVSPFQEYQQLLVSPAVAQALQKRYRLLQQIYPERWDESTKSWLKPVGLRPMLSGAVKGFFGLPAWMPPGDEDLMRYLQDNVRVVSVPDTSMRQIKVTNPSPTRAMWLLNALNREVDGIIRREAVERTTAQIAYLDRKVGSVTNVAHVEAIGRLITDQEQMLMMTQINQPYAARIVGFASVSDRPVSPRVGVAFAFAILLGLIFGIILVFVLRATMRGGGGRSVLLMAAEAGAHNSGMGVYAFEHARRIAPALAARGYNVTVMVRRDAVALIDDLQAAGVEMILLASSGTNPWLKLLELYWVCFRRGGNFDLIYSLDHKMPVGNSVAALKIFTLHDCCYRSFPEETGAARQFFFRRSHAAAARRLDRIVTVSRNAAAAISHYYHVPSSRISVISPAIDTGAFGDAARDPGVLARYGIQRPGYFLFVGRVSPRKNLKLIIEALALLRASGRQAQLVIAGPPGWRNERDGKLAQEKGVASLIHVTGFVDQQDLPALYADAAALLYPSFCEGFGIPVLEALASGTPAVVGRNTASHEIGNGFVHAVDPRNAAEMAELMRELLQGAAHGRPADAAVLRHLAQFDWDSISARAVQMVADVLDARIGRAVPAADAHAGTPA